MELRSPREFEHGEIRALLSDSGLPDDDFDTAAIAFIVAADLDRITGVVGLETFGDAGLLRSLAVRTASRRSGTGAMLVGALEAQARTCGLRELVLLTQTAEPFFSKRGYRVVPRADVPESVQHSSQFRSLCPVSAICMTKSLAKP